MKALEQVEVVFTELRELGYMARFNFMCCSSCAGYNLAVEAEELFDAGKADGITGCVFCHEQDIDGVEERGKLHIRYGPLDTNKHGQIGKDAQLIGNEVSELFKERGFDVEWDGSPGNTIILNNISGEE